MSMGKQAGGKGAEDIKFLNEAVMTMAEETMVWRDLTLLRESGEGLLEAVSRSGFRLLACPPPEAPPPPPRPLLGLGNVRITQSPSGLGQPRTGGNRYA